jgi:hypothetical protein
MMRNKHLLGVPEEEVARIVGDVHGYGAMMSALERVWHEKAKISGLHGSEFVCGPVESAVVPCGCDVPHECDWCAGCGWLTKHVKSVKDKAVISDDDRALIVKFLSKMLGGAKRFGYPEDEYYMISSGLQVKDVEELNALLNRVQKGTGRDE